MSYTNIDGLIPKKMECVHYLKVMELDIKCIVKTKSNMDIELGCLNELDL